MNIKRIVLLLNVCLCLENLFAQYTHTAVGVIREFSQILDELHETRNLAVCGPKFHNLCDERIRCRVNNDLINRMTIGKTFDDYIGGINEMIKNGCCITIENIKYDSEISKLMQADNKGDFVKYDIVVSENLNTKNRYTDCAKIVDGKIMFINTYASINNYAKALQTLFPYFDSKKHELYGPHWDIDLSKAKTAFNTFREIAYSGCDRSLVSESMGMMVAMEMAGIGCEHIGKYAKMIDIASYFVLRSYCPNIVKRYGGYFLDGIKSDFETWDLYKQHPYINSKGSGYFHYIYPRYRPMTNINSPYVKKEGNNYGFASEEGKEIIECKYSFAYPFDRLSGLSAVRDEKHKWGFINKTGKLIIPHIYDVVNDVFVDGKNLVIKDNCLILIDVNGKELRRISGYNYVIPKLRENEIIAYNGLKLQFDVYDFYGNLLLEDCFSSANMSKKGYERFYFYYNFDWNGFTYNQKDDVNENVSWLPRIPIEISSSDISSGEAIDLGTGILWASRNLGSSSCSDMGNLYLWGDYKSEYTNKRRNRTNGKKFRKELLDRGFPSDIAGTYLDIATQTLGNDWRIPNKEELRKLVEECVWIYCILNGKKGYKIVGKNGNSIFLPVEGEFYFESYKTQCESGAACVLYWSSELSFSDEPYGLQISEYGFKIRKGIELAYWNYVRPVRLKKE